MIPSTVDVRNIALSYAMEYYKETSIPPAQIVEVANIFLTFLEGTSA